jgi:hypothetical protein
MKHHEGRDALAGQVKLFVYRVFSLIVMMVVAVTVELTPLNAASHEWYISATEQVSFIST